MAYKEAGKELKYVVLPGTREVHPVAKRTPVKKRAAALWIDRLDEEERQEYEAWLFRGLPADLFREMCARGFAKDADWDRDEGIDLGLRETANDAYAKRVLSKFLMADKKRLTRKERRVRYSMVDGRFLLARSFREYNLQTLIDRCRRVLKREAEEKRQSAERINDACIADIMKFCEYGKERNEDDGETE